MAILRTLGLLVLVAALTAGCGDSAGKRAATRPAQLFTTPPKGLSYKEADAATTKRIEGQLKKSVPALKSDDVAVRQVEKKRALGPEAVAVAVALDALDDASPDDTAKGFDEGVKQATGKPSQELQIAGTQVNLAKLSGAYTAIATKNGYVLETFAVDAATTKAVLRQLIGAAGTAKR